jgi:thymidylate synthase
LKCDLWDGFPALTTKKLFFRGAAEEMFWFMRGERNIKTLVDKGVNIWNANVYDLYLRRNGLDNNVKKHTLEWNEGFSEFVDRIKNDSEFAAKEGDAGPIYGYQWRHWKTANGEIDQLRGIIDKLKKDKGTRYALMHAWKPEDLSDMALAPCHVWYQYSVFENKFLDLHMVQRSCDTFLGVPFNRVGPAIQQTLIARELGLIPREFYHTLINVHLYNGVPPRSEFLRDDANLETFRNKIKKADRREDYLEIREWYLNSAPEEGALHEGKDHIPYVLQQLSYEPMELPKLEINSDLPLFELINKPAGDVLRLDNYNFHKWDSNALMAA